MEQLVAAVLKDPVAALHGRSPAADELVAIGPAALPAVRKVLGGTWASDAHPKDVLEAFMLIAQRIAPGRRAGAASQPPNEALQLTRRYAHEVAPWPTSRPLSILARAMQETLQLS